MIPIAYPLPGSGLPEFKCALDERGSDAQNTYADRGLRTDAVSTVDRAKLEIRLPTQDFRLNVATCILIGGVIWSNPSCVGIAEDVGWSAVGVPASFQGQAADAWVESPPGAPLEFGTFPPVRVRAVAFGNIPVEATAHISQTVTNGLVDPMRYDWMLSVIGLPEGTVMPGYEEVGPRPEGKREWAFPAVVEGPVQIRLSDVRVDGVPVAVGSSCRTSPTTLRFRNPPGWFDNVAAARGDIPPGEPGAFSALDTAVEGIAAISGTIDIPPFRGCGRDGDDLDPLITAMVSGPANPVTATVDHVTSRWCVDGFTPRADRGGPPNEERYTNGSCPLEDYDGWNIERGLRATRHAGSPDPLAEVPQWVLDKMSRPEVREVRRLMRMSP